MSAEVKKNLKTFAFVVLMYLYLVQLGYPRIAYANPADEEQEARELLSNATGSIQKAFKDLASADEAGANVTNLVNQLRLALDLTDEAYVKYGEGNYSASILLSKKAVILANDTSNRADFLKQVALRDQMIEKSFTIVLIVGVDLIICVFGVWFIHKGFHRFGMAKKRQGLDER